VHKATVDCKLVPTIHTFAHVGVFKQYAYVICGLPRVMRWD